MPEFKASFHKKGSPAVAGASGSEAAAAAESSGSTEEIEWEWGQGLPETMHPCWAVRRLTQQQLDDEIDAASKTSKTAVAARQERNTGFNCALEEYARSLANVAAVGGVASNTARVTHVPYLTSTMVL